MAERVASNKNLPKVLRIGVLHGGKVVQERLVRPGADVTIGESPRNTFVVSGKGVPKRYTLFVARGSRYQLAFTADMDGKVALDKGVATFKDLRAKPATHKKGGAWSIPLSERSRGKISLGELTVLFQFVPAPPESARLIGATDFRPKLIDDDDPVFLGFLALFSAMAAVLMVYVFNTEPVELVKPGEIPDRFVDMIITEASPREAEEAPPPLESEDGNIVQKEVEPEATEPKERKSEPKTEAEKQAAEAAAAAKKREDTIQSSKLLMALIGTRGENNSGQMVEDLLGEQDNKLGSLQNALQNVDGAAVGSRSSIEANKGATDRSGAGDVGIGDMDRAGTGTGAGVANGPGTKVSGRVTNDLDLSDVEGGEAAGKTIKRYKGQVQNCYEGELKLNPSLRGRLAVVINVVSGAVRSVEVEDNGTGSKALGDCVKSRVRRWHFDAEVTGPVYSTFVLEPSG